MSLGVVTAGAAKHPSAIQVMQTTDLASVASIARDRKLPILLVFSAHHCTYCELLENEILKPMLLSGDYRERVLIYKIMLDDESELQDFNGNTISPSTLSQRYNVYVTPTMLFLDANGEELSERILGINTVELFGGLVDQAIDTSLAQLHTVNNRVASSKLTDKE
jgi:thioredoxin-related protein